jgi:hypothetical protein
MWVLTWPILAVDVAFWYASLTRSADHGNLPDCTGEANTQSSSDENSVLARQLSNTVSISESMGIVFFE